MRQLARPITLSPTEEELFDLGLARVARPIERNRTYNQILGNRLDLFFERYGYDLDKDLSPDTALAILDRSMVKRRNAIQMIPPVDAIAWGKTRNNLREFSFLRRVLKRNGLTDNIFNVSHHRFRQTDYISTAPYIPKLRALFLKFCQDNWPVSPAGLYQLVNYIHAYVNWRSTFSQATRLPHVLVLANDHSPNQAAAMAVAEDRQVATVYIQHAEVTSAFPPLRFDLSILRNHASLKAYEEVGPCIGRTHILSRFDTPFHIDKFDQASVNPVTVGIYLTAQVVWSGVRQVLSELQANPAIRSIFVKPHPSQPFDTLASELPGIRISRDMPTTPHVAVVANSSVVVELLHHGNVVFQNYDMDTVPRDYYGFSASNIAPEVSANNLKQEFWLDFLADDTWRTAYQTYDPWALDDYSDNEKRLASDLRDLFPAQAVGSSIHQTRGRVEQAYSRTKTGLHVGRQMVELVPNTVIDYSNEANRFAPAVWCEQTSELNFSAAMDGIFADRVANSYDLLAITRRIKSIACDLVYTSKRRDIELSGRGVSESELDTLTAYLSEMPFDAKSDWGREIEFFNFLLRLQQDERIKTHFRTLPPIPVKKLGINRRIAMMKWLRGSPLAQAAVKLTPADLYTGLVAFQRLKLRTLSADAETFARSPWTHQEIEDEFLASASPGVQQEYREIYKPFFDKIRPRMQFMDVRWSTRQRQEFNGLVTIALAKQRSLSMIRLSDREAYMFADQQGRYFTQDDVENCERHWWRRQLTQDERSRLTEQMRDAAAKADVLGVPCIYRLQRELDAKTKSSLGSLQVRGLAEVAHNVSRHSANLEQIFTEEKSNIPLFSNFQEVLGLCESAKRTVLVASASEPKARLLFPGHLQLEYIAIPTHSRTMTNDSYAKTAKSLPQVYEQIRDQIAQTVTPGDLVMVAAGIIGKIFVDDAKQAGGVALDIGTCLDAWVGARIQSLH